MAILFKVLFVIFFVASLGWFTYFWHMLLMLSWSWALFELRFNIIFSILSAEKLIVCNLLSVPYLGFLGSLLQLFNEEHWLQKKEWKSSAFSLKFVIKQFSWSNCGISWIFYCLERFLTKTNKFWCFFSIF